MHTQASHITQKLHWGYAASAIRRRWRSFRAPTRDILSSDLLGYPALLPRPTLSVCMMVQNSSRTLPIALQSIAGLADEILLVDGGSTDHTLEIARSFGCRLIESPWPGNNSVQRNVYLESVRTDWVLTIDADEFLPPTCKDILMHALSIPRLTAVVFPRRLIKTLSPPLYILAGPAGVDVQLRMFRRTRNMRYTGAVHETLLGLHGLRFLLRDTPIYHLDFLLNSREQRESKVQRYERMDPGNPWHRWCLYEDYGLESTAIPEGHLPNCLTEQCEPGGAPVAFTDLVRGQIVPEGSHGSRR